MKDLMKVLIFVGLLALWMNTSSHLLIFAPSAIIAPTTSVLPSFEASIKVVVKAFCSLSIKLS